MYLSEITINLNRRAGRDLVSSPQRLHGVVLGCFSPGGSVSDQARTLWRLDQGKVAPKLLISSPLKPDFEGLSESVGWMNGAAHRSAPYDGFLSSLQEGQVWRFRLVANPTIAVRNEQNPKGRGKRLAHVTVAQQTHWLLGRADRLGVLFAPNDTAPPVVLTRRQILEFTKGPGSRRVTIASAQLDGAFSVKDPLLLREALVHGVGGAKAYGCGLMTLAPAS